MKTSVKKKTDVKITENKPIKLNTWEKDFLEILQSEENPTFNKVPGALSAGTHEGNTSVKPVSHVSITEENNALQKNEAKADVQDAKLVRGTANSIGKVRKSTGKVKKYENDKTKDLSTPHLQRIVLLQQMEVNKMKIQREKLMLEKIKTCLADKSTQRRSWENF